MFDKDSYGDLANVDLPWKENGLPLLSPDDVPQCGGNASMPPCDRDGIMLLIHVAQSLYSPLPF